MIFDTENLFSDHQAITANAASSNVLDLGAAGRDIGVGESVPLQIQVTEAFDNLTSLAVAFQTSVDEAFSSPIELAASTVLLADLVAGKKFPITNVPEGTKRYNRLYYTVTGTAPTAGKIKAGIVEAN